MSDSRSSFATTFLARPFWIMIGPLALAISLYYIVTSGTGWTTFADLIFFLVLGGMALGRWVDFQGDQPRDSFGEPASPSDLRRYLVTLAIAGPAVWLLANYLGNHLLGRE